MFNKIAFVCSAYQGAEENLVLARKYCQYILKRERIPFAPRLLFPQFLDENTPKERRFGIELGEVFMNRCDEMWVFVRNGILSPGMAEEIEYAHNFFWGNIFYFDATNILDIIELKHIPTNTGLKRYKIPVQSQLLAPNSFSNKAQIGMLPPPRTGMGSLPNVAATAFAAARYSFESIGVMYGSPP